ncbi:hypothetical protein NDU88_001358 [Pleurodeles waltl]|uniref:Uncharacterized protein n=1 Tax=Pleurodeles waltl TaxID=8319 RepID=A0AAV7VW85_PLEWA|nr:hypothetical protein NDU88_001358 [Pleurodeles waltl]
MAHEEDGKVQQSGGSTKRRKEKGFERLEQERGELDGMVRGRSEQGGQSDAEELMQVNVEGEQEITEGEQKSAEEKHKGTQSKSRDWSVSPLRQRRTAWEFSPTITSQSPQASRAPSLIEVFESPVSPLVHFSPLSTQESVAQALDLTQEPQDEQRFPGFPTPRVDPVAFLNAMFSIFNRAMAPAGATVGLTGPLAFSLGSPET